MTSQTGRGFALGRPRVELLPDRHARRDGEVLAAERGVADEGVEDEGEGLLVAQRRLSQEVPARGVGADERAGVSGGYDMAMTRRPSTMWRSKGLFVFERVAALPRCGRTAEPRAGRSRPHQSRSQTWESRALLDGGQASK